MDGPYPSVDSFWRENSYDAINLANSIVAGNQWYTIGTKSHYYYDDPDDTVAGPVMHLDTLLDDAIAAANTSSLIFTTYEGINIVYNNPIVSDMPAFASTRKRGVDLPSGCTKTYGITWLPPFAVADVKAWAHEIGHTIGFPHSAGPYTTHPMYPYTSVYDVMSNGGNQIIRSVYGYTADHTIAYHKRYRVADLGGAAPPGGWIPDSRVFTAAPNAMQQVIIDNHAVLGSSNYLLAVVPIGSNQNQFYTIEARKWVGPFESNNLPRQGILIHRINRTASTNHVDATVMDVDYPDGTGNGQVNDDGSVWIPGEVFTDANARVQIAVNYETSAGLAVTITTGTVVPPPPPSPDYSLHYDLSNYVKVRDAESISALSSLTVEAWIYVDPVFGSNRAIVSKRNSVTGGGGYELSINSTLDVTFATYDADGIERASITSNNVTPNPLVAGVWSHVSGSYDATTRTLRVTANGRIWAHTYTASKAPANGTTSLNIGRSGIMGNSFLGRIDEVRISNSVRYLGNTGDGFIPATSFPCSPCDVSTRALWRFSENGGLMTFDMASGNTGTLVPMNDPPAWSPGVTSAP